VRGPSSDRLVDRSDGSVRQGLLVAGQEAKIRDEGSPEESQSEVRSDVHLQKYRLRVSLSFSLDFVEYVAESHLSRIREPRIWKSLISNLVMECGGADVGVGVVCVCLFGLSGWMGVGGLITGDAML